MKLVRWFIGIVGGTLVGLWIALALVSRAPGPAGKLVEALDDKLDADVELESFEVKTFPTLRIHGENLKLRLKDQKNPAPFIEIRHFEVVGRPLRPAAPPETIQLRRVVGAAHHHSAANPGRQGRGQAKTTNAVAGPVLIDPSRRRTPQLIIVPKNPLKQPKIFAIHDLQLESVGFNRDDAVRRDADQPDSRRERSRPRARSARGSRATRA